MSKQHKSDTQKIVAAVVLLILTIIGFLILEWSAVWGWLFLFFTLYTGLAIVADGIKKKCPSCGEWWSKTTVARQFLGSRGRWETHYQYATTITSTDHFDKLGYYSGRSTSTSTTSFPRTVYVTYESYLETYRCKYCSFEWRGTKTYRRTR